MLDRCIKCGERCREDGSQWSECERLDDDEWEGLFEAGALLLLGFEGIEAF
jgi:hypothetical protein